MSNESAFVTELLDGQIFSEQTLLVHTTNIKVAVERERESLFPIKQLRDQSTFITRYFILAEKAGECSLTLPRKLLSRR